MKIKTKILVAPMAAVALFGAYVALQLAVAAKQLDALDSLHKSYMPASKQSAAAIQAVKNIDQTLLLALPAGDKDEAKKTVQTAKLAQSDLEELSKNLSGKADALSKRALGAKDSVAQYHGLALSAALGMMGEKPENASKAMEAAKAKDALQAELEGIDRQLQEGMAELTESAAKSQKQAMAAGLALAALAAAGSLFAAYALAARIVQPIEKVGGQLSKMAEGQETGVKLRMDGDDEISGMLGSFNAYLDRVESQERQAAGLLGRLGAAAKELSAVAQEAGGAQQRQREAIERSGSLASQVSADSQRIASSTQGALEEARLARDLAKSSGSEIQDQAKKLLMASDLLDKTNSTVEELLASGRQIDSMVESIKGISSQTNLLALNAAIEAARAGESGRGFAVVADEVRKMAAMTQETSQEISTIVSSLGQSIEATASAVKEGSQMALESARAVESFAQGFLSMQQAAEGLLNASAGIAEASLQQQADTESIGQAMGRLTELSNQAAEGMEKIERVAQSIRNAGAA